MARSICSNDVSSSSCRPERCWSRAASPGWQGTRVSFTTMGASGSVEQWKSPTLTGTSSRTEDQYEPGQETLRMPRVFQARQLRTNTLV